MDGGVGGARRDRAVIDRHRDDASAQDHHSLPDRGRKEQRRGLGRHAIRTPRFHPGHLDEPVLADALCRGARALRLAHDPARLRLRAPAVRARRQARLRNQLRGARCAGPQVRRWHDPGRENSQRHRPWQGRRHGALCPDTARRGRAGRRRILDMGSDRGIRLRSAARADPGPALAQSAGLCRHQLSRRRGGWTA